MGRVVKDKEGVSGFGDTLFTIRQSVFSRRIRSGGVRLVFVDQCS